MRRHPPPDGRKPTMVTSRAPPFEFGCFPPGGPSCRPRCLPVFRDSAHSHLSSRGPSAMLVLSRRPDEKILLPSVPALIKVISSQAGLVRLGIEAPSHVPILREELVSSRPGLPPAEAPSGA